jgi:hypothetical protein
MVEHEVIDFGIVGLGRMTWEDFFQKSKEPGFRFKIPNVQSKLFTREDMKSFGDHCRIVMSPGMSDVAKNALLDTWIKNRGNGQI